MLKALLQNFWLVLCVGSIFFTGCVGKPTVNTKDIYEKTSSDTSEEELKSLKRQLTEQSRVIDRLTDSLSALKGEMTIVKENNNSANVKANKSSKIYKLESDPTIDEDLNDDDDDDDAQEPTGKVIADNQNEAMRFYYDGLRYQKEKLYEESILALEKFLKANPDHVYSDRAQYLLTYDYLQNKEYGLALISSNKLEAQYPNSFKLADALYARALAYKGMGQSANAIKTLEELMQRYPGDQTSTLAAKKLADLLVEKPNNSPGHEPNAPPMLLDSP